MIRLLSLAVLAGAGYCAWRYYQAKARPDARIPALPSDELLERRVQVSIRQAGALPEQLRMRVVGGTVVLAGTVTAAERDRILRAILAAPGIRGVRNELDVQGVVRDPDLAVESRPWEPSPRPR
jgi:hypothetical protein